jgi:hypothetical protein
MFGRGAVGFYLSFCLVFWLRPACFSALVAQDATAEASGDALAAILQRMHANLVANDELAEQYACDDSEHFVQWSTKGRKLHEMTAKFEVVIVEGLPYRHMVEKNGKPLSAQRLISEQRRQDILSELGKNFDFEFYFTDASPSGALLSELPICCLTSLFDNRLLRHEQIDGRDNLVIESVPKANPGTPSGAGKTALDWKETTWIDSRALMPARFEVELLNTKGSLLKGSRDRRDFFPLEVPGDSSGHPPQTVWLLRHDEGHFSLKILWSRQTEFWEDSSTNFRRFTVNARILPDSVRDVPQQSVGSKP